MADLLGEAYVRVRADNRMLRPGLKQAEDETKKSMDRISRWGSTIKGAIAGIAVTALLTNEFREATKAAQDQFEADRRLEAALKATGHAAGLSAEELKAHAAALQNLTGIADDEIQAFQARLLNFTNVQGDTFKRATELAVDMSQALGTDLATAGAMLGKALNDPIGGMTALQKVLGKTNEATKEHIKQLVLAGRGAEAQAIILDLLESKFGGTAEAMTGGPHGGLKLLSAQLAEAREGLGEVLVPLQEIGLKAQIVFTGVLKTFAPMIVAVTQGLFDLFVNTITWLGTFVLNWDQTWVAIEAGAHAFTLAARDYFFGFINFALKSLKDFASDSVKIFTLLPELIKAAVSQGSYGILNVLDMEFKKSFAKLAKNFGDSMVLGPEAKAAMVAASAEIGKLAAKQQELKDKLFAPPGTDKGPFARPKAGAMDFNKGESKDSKQSMTGFFGLEDFSKRLQDAMLKDNKTDQLIGIGQAQENIQKQLLDEARKSREEAARRPAVPVANP